MGFKPLKFEIGRAPHELIIALKEKYEIKNFVETGTYLGETTAWASKNFERVFSYEAAESIYIKTKEKLQAIPNIEFILGESDKELSKLNLNGPAVFWLDAHYSAGETFNGEVPLIKELEIINSWNFDTFVFIDDARFVLAKWQNQHYCDLATLIKVLSVKNKYVAVIDDVIIGVPYYAKESVNDYSNKISEIYWSNFLKEINGTPKKTVGNTFKRFIGKLKNQAPD